MFYGKITKADFKVKICRYFMNYCNNHHISSTNDGLSAMVNIKKCQLIWECKIVCVKSNCADLFYAPYWGKQLKGWISNGKT